MADDYTPSSARRIAPSPMGRASADDCPDCRGDGAIYIQVRVGQHSTPFACRRCDGDGEIAHYPKEAP